MTSTTSSSLPVSGGEPTSHATTEPADVPARALTPPPEHHAAASNVIVAEGIELEAVAVDDGSALSTQESAAAAPVVYPPFPTKSVLIVSACLFANSVNMVILFPFISAMVQSYGVASTQADVGYYAGFLASSLFFGRILSSYKLGKYSDQHGRKPVLALGLWAMIISSIALGFSKNLYFSVFLRFLSGFLNAIIGTGKSLVAELCVGPENSAKGISIIGGAFGVGLVFGSASGGLLAIPAEKYPSVFAGTIFDTNPFLLPLLCASVVPIVCLPLMYFYLPETVHSTGPMIPCMKTSTPYSNMDDSKHTEEGEPAGLKPEKPKGPSAWELLVQPSVLAAVCLYSGHSFLVIAFDEIYPIFAALDQGSGGLGFDTNAIGFSLGVTGFAVLIIQVWLYPRIAKRFGPMKCFLYPSIVMIPVTFFFPYLNVLDNYPTAQQFVLIIVLGMRQANTLTAFTAAFVLINESVETTLVGAVNGLATTGASITRCISPLMAAPLFAWSVQPDRSPIWGGPHLVFVILTLLNIGIVIVAMRIAKRRQEREDAKAAAKAAAVAEIEASKEAGSTE